MESEYETDSEDEELGCRLIKPVFVPQNEREVCSSCFHIADLNIMFSRTLTLVI